MENKLIELIKLGDAKSLELAYEIAEKQNKLEEFRVLIEKEEARTYNKECQLINQFWYIKTPRGVDVYRKSQNEKLMETLVRKRERLTKFLK